MNYGQIFTADGANGVGMRVSLFVSGCTNQCKGCFQPETWDFSYGRPYTQETEDFLIQEVSKSYYRGLTILGGEPFEVDNQRELVKLIRRMKKECPSKDIWMYTGFVYEKDLLPGGRRYTEVTDEILDSISLNGCESNEMAGKRAIPNAADMIQYNRCSLRKVKRVIRS